jgi:hypothetical protein
LRVFAGAQGFLGFWALHSPLTTSHLLVASCASSAAYGVLGFGAFVPITNSIPPAPESGSVAATLLMSVFLVFSRLLQICSSRDGRFGVTPRAIDFAFDYLAGADRIMRRMIRLRRTVDFRLAARDGKCRTKPKGEKNCEDGRRATGKV